MGTKTRQLPRAFTVAATLAIAMGVHADWQRNTNREFTGHTIQDCLQGHTIQDCIGDRLGGATWGGDDWIKKITTITGGHVVSAEEKLRLLFDAYAVGAVDMLDVANIVELYIFQTPHDVAADQARLLAEAVGNPAEVDLVRVTSDNDQVGGGPVLTAQGIPAPGALSLLGLGALSLLGRRRRRI
jgi:uncharacterized protein (TIGR03382 family)